MTQQGLQVVYELPLTTEQQGPHPLRMCPLDITRIVIHKYNLS